MMTSLGNDRSRGVREKVAPAGTQAAQNQKQIQATAEQLRLAQVIYDSNDADFEDKVKQLIEVTGKNQDECVVALHDCNEDVNRAINFLLEDSLDVNSWETVGKKRSLAKDASSAETRENQREKKGERESGRGRGGPTRRARGGSHSREVRSEENGTDQLPMGRGLERGRRGRGRGTAGRGRGRPTGGSRFTAQGMGTFNPADYTAESATGGSDSWETGVNDGCDGTAGAWRNTLEDWASEEWNEDVSLSETKVFTASCAPVVENHVSAGQSVDLTSLLQKSSDNGEQGGIESPSPQSLPSQGSSLVFTNSLHPHHSCNGGSNSSASTAISYAHATMSSVLGSGFGELGRASKMLLEQAKNTNVGQMGSQQSSEAVPQGSAVVMSCSSWESKALSSQAASPLPSQFSREFKTQPEPSLVLSQLSQRQQSSASLQRALPAESLPKPRESSPSRDVVTTGVKLPPLPTAGGDIQTSSTQQRQIKSQKRRIPPTSKIPSSAVEMPGSADVSGLNVQFGALDFGSEAALQDFTQQESSSGQEAQPPSSLYGNPVGESRSSPLSLPLASESPYPTSSASLPVSTTPTSSSTAPQASAYESAVAPSHSRLAFSQNKDSTAAPITNGFNGVRTPTSLETTSVTAIPKQESAPLPGSGSVPPPSVALVPAHSSACPPLGSDLPPMPLPSLSSNHVNSHSSGSALTSSTSLTYSGVDAGGSLPPSSVTSYTSNPVLHSSSTSGSGGIGVTSNVQGASLGLGPNGTPAASACRNAPLLTSASSKAPPNLPQGVPPLLPNQYIMGPGGLLPAYPIYGYEDLHVLQSRLPMDYYGVTFPGPTATLPNREASLANNPYSGEVTKFGRADSSSPAPPSNTLSAPQPPPQSQQQNQTQQQQQQSHHTTQQPFLNPALPPGYSYTGLPYYPGMPGVPSAFQYGPTVFMPQASAKQHSVGLSNPSGPFQQPSSYTQHSYSSGGYDDVTQGSATGDYSKGGYGATSQTQPKPAATGPGKVSVTSSNSGVPDISGSVYKTQSFDKQGFHTGTPPPFGLPSALGGAGPLNPAPAAPGYGPAPFLHILPAHQQPQSQLLHHHLTPEGQGGPNQRTPSVSMPPKTQANKSSYGSSPYWGN